MSSQPVSVEDLADAAESRHELLSRLGLPADASDHAVEAARTLLVEFLELSPRKVNSWAAAQTVDVDEAFALLSGPEQLLISASQRVLRVQSRLDETAARLGPTPVVPVAAAAAATGKRWRTR